MKQNDIGFQTINYLVFILIMIVCIYPFYYLFIYSISDPVQAAKGIYLWPKSITFETYIQMFKLEKISISFGVSAARAIIGTIVTVFCTTLFGYLLTKREMYLRKTVYRFVVITLYLNSGLIPWYITMKELGLKNNFLLYILPTAVIGFYLILVKTYIESLPPALEESAMIDGAGYLTIFMKIIFPVSVPIIAAIAVFSAVNQWNSWTDNYFLVSDKHLQTLQLTLLNYLKESESLASASSMELTRQGAKIRLTPMTVRVTISMIVSIPILLVYPFLQRYFVKGIMLGAIKG
ncbi:carbohydrate ABC transporter permease [Paenibacillus psychroresistens]|uniref:Carbohydrate ABC transporter permease n=1 Tax=Paenibacillus psychroresistens TaxID=1778678 RepID=A0A6B8RRZ1_9BACL|nr:carbohydrate ABC transporter permease [Paenibacillus psychroresistens]QGQ99171.1 carbohydrate ABC transporter permease [Paenibacillus psychroresistens]